MNKGELKVISPRDGSPAAAAGIKPGDLILAIDKGPTYELSLAEPSSNCAARPAARWS